MTGKRSLILLYSLGVCSLFAGELLAQDGGTIDSGATAWMLASCALVLLMTPGLALFYGGMVRTKNVLGTIMHSLFCMAIISIQWVVIGYSIAFGPSNGGFFGGLDYAFLNGVAWDAARDGESIPHLVFMTFQMMFAIITPALITGAFAERVRFGPYVVFTLLWATLVYDPIAHWVWGGGILSGSEHSWLKMFGTGALDFAGGTVVHISSGVSALVLVLMIGKRRGYPDQPVLPNNLVFTVLGAGILWFGWFGFNGGSGLDSNGLAGLAFTVTHLCAASGALSWAVVEWVHRGKVSVLGVATGLIAGLVCITPASGYVLPMPALVMGLIVGPICYYFVAILKGKLGYDDSLDAFGVHGVGGTVGALLTGLLFDYGVAGLAESGDDAVSRGSQFGAQAVAVLVTWVYAGGVTAILVVIIDKTMGFRISEEDEATGLDVSQHDETGYNM